MTTDIAYAWKIERLDCYPSLDAFENVVTDVHWRLFASGGGCQATRYGTVSLDVGGLETDFTPFEQLTEAQVVGWVKASLDAAAHEAALARDIADQLSPPIVSPPLPWQTVDPAADPAADV